MKRLIVACLAASFITSLAFANAPSTFSAPLRQTLHQWFGQRICSGLGEMPFSKQGLFIAGAGYARAKF